MYMRTYYYYYHVPTYHGAANCNCFLLLPSVLYLVLLTTHYHNNNNILNWIEYDCMMAVSAAVLKIRRVNNVAHVMRFWYQ